MELTKGYYSGSGMSSLPFILLSNFYGIVMIRFMSI